MYTRQAKSPSTCGNFLVLPRASRLDLLLGGTLDTTSGNSGGSGSLRPDVESSLRAGAVPSVRRLAALSLRKLALGVAVCGLGPRRLARILEG